jgi:uncharacterized protein
VKAGLLDVNVMLALGWPNHQHHAAAHRWFKKEAAHGWATCALTQLAFIRLSSNPSFTPAAVAPRIAAELLARMIARPGHQYWADVPASDPTIYARSVGHRQVMDAYLVALAGHHRGRVVTFDGGLRVHTKDPSTVSVLAV